MPDIRKSFSNVHLDVKINWISPATLENSTTVITLALMLSNFKTKCKTWYISTSIVTWGSSGASKDATFHWIESSWFHALLFSQNSANFNYCPKWKLLAQFWTFLKIKKFGWKSQFFEEFPFFSCPSWLTGNKSSITKWIGTKNPVSLAHTAKIKIDQNCKTHPEIFQKTNSTFLVQLFELYNFVLGSKKIHPL